MITTDTHIYFYGMSEIYSNWHRAGFIDPITGIAFANTEAAFMWEKADFFKDDKIKPLIALESDPRSVKALGRQIRGFDGKAWDCVKFGYMVYANYLKFSQNDELKKQLVLTGDRVLVESSPYDAIWGCLLSEDDPLILDEKNWRGQNLLGKALMEVRKMLKT